jgi:hypothetical protein
MLRRVISASISAEAFRKLQEIERQHNLTRSQAVDFAILKAPNS